MSSTPATTTTTTPAEPKTKVDLGLLEEDDEFEEFPTENWSGKADAADDDEIKVWEDNWDEDNIEDDFSNQLKAELEKQGHVKGPGAQGKK